MMNKPNQAGAPCLLSASVSDQLSDNQVKAITRDVETQYPGCTVRLTRKAGVKRTADHRADHLKAPGGSCDCDTPTYGYEETLIAFVRFLDSQVKLRLGAMTGNLAAQK